MSYRLPMRVQAREPIMSSHQNIEQPICARSADRRVLLRNVMKSAWSGLAVIAVIATAPPVLATEGGGSFYLQGMQGDFGAALIGPSGFYLRQDIALYDASAGVRPVGDRVSLGTDLSAWLSVTRVAYAWEGEILGARAMSGIAIPFALDLNASGLAAGYGYQDFRAGDRTGLGDIAFQPLRLSWNFGHHHLALGPVIYAPTGGYSTDRIINTGRNRWGFDVAGAYTWLNPTRGHEVSVTGGYLINSCNNATGYDSGNEAHVDWLVAQHFSPRFGIAAVGYWYQQVTDDGGNQPFPFKGRGFRGSGVGVGAAIITKPFAERSISLIGKWVHDLDTSNRFNGDIFIASVAFAF
jgi:hypothetical protein